MIAPLDQLCLFFLVCCRCGGVVAGFPIGNENNGIPMSVKALFTCCLSYLVFQFLPITFVASSYHAFNLCLLATREILIGLSIGFIVKISFAMIELAGHLIANEIGLNTGESFNPITESSSSFISILLVQLACVYFFISGLDKEILYCFIKSYTVLDIKLALSIKNFPLLIDYIQNIFLISFKIAAPLVLLNFLVNFCFAILGKAAPKINVFFLSFPLRIFSGFCLFSLILYLIAGHINDNFLALPEQIFRFLRA